MDIHITSRHCKLTNDEHSAAIKAAEHLMKFHENILRVDIVASEDAGQKGAEFAVKVQGQTIVAKENGPDHIKAIHDAREKVERQLRRFNDRQHNVRTTILP
jgi:ribosomal subunit interface protein